VGIRTEIEVPGAERPDRPEGLFQPCGEQCIEAVGRPLLQGRSLSAEDVQGARRVAVVNRALVDRYIEGQNPLGRTVRIARLADTSAIPSDAQPLADPVFEIVGVVANVPNQGPRQEPLPHVYVPYTVAAWDGEIVARTSADPSALLAALQREVRAADPGVVFQGGGTLQEWLGVRHAQPRFSVIVLAAFATAGMLLMALGIYSVLAYHVSLQSREIAIRMALGADRSSVLGVVLVQGLRLIGLGTAAGLLASLATNRLISGTVGYALMDVSSYDPLALGLALAAVAAIGLLACYAPGRRAVGVDPMQALRQD